MPRRKCVLPRWKCAQEREGDILRVVPKILNFERFLVEALIFRLAGVFRGSDILKLKKKKMRKFYINKEVLYMLNYKALLYYKIQEHFCSKSEDGIF